MFQMDQQFVVIGTFSNRLMCVPVLDLEPSHRNLKNGAEVFFEVASEYLKGRILSRGGTFHCNCHYYLLQLFNLNLLNSLTRECSLLLIVLFVHRQTQVSYRHP